MVVSSSPPGTPPPASPSQGPAPAGPPQVRSIKCPACGATIPVRSFSHAVTIVCESCHSILDAQDPGLKIMQQFKVVAGEDRPLIPLGARGKIRGTLYEVIGFMRRTIIVEDISYDWHEYLLFNPYQGFRYLTEYQGHWNDITLCKVLPSISSKLSAEMNYLGEEYHHFQTADAITAFVLGEFPWQVRVGGQAAVTDYVHPPRVLSSERDDKEVTWSIGEYTAGTDIWKAFNLPGDPPEAIGVYENQPSPIGAATRAIWLTCAWFVVALIAMLFVVVATAKEAPAFSASYQFYTNYPPSEPSFVTDVFQLEGRTSNVQLTTTANVHNNWIYLNFALINQDTGEAWDFGRQVSYYTGYDDGYWSEGSTVDRVVVPSVPSGNYYLRIEPESDRGRGTIQYSVNVRRDVPVMGFFGIAFLALIIPAAFIAWRYLSFEHMRWQESDHPPASASSLLKIGDDS